MRSIRRGRTLPVMAALALVLAACGDGDDSAEPSQTLATAPASGTAATATTQPATTTTLEPAKVTTTIFEGAVFSLPQYVAQDKGFFEDEGLTVENVAIASGPAGATALASGGVDFMVNSPDFVVLAREQGQLQKVVGANTTRGITAVLIRSDVAQPNQAKPYPENAVDLEGLSVGITARGSSAEFIVEGVATDAGIDPNRLTYVAVGGVGPALAALEARQIEAWNGFEPGISICVYQMKLCNIVADFRAGVGPEQLTDYHPNVIAANESFIEEHPDRVDRFVRALGNAMKWMQDPANRDELAEVIRQRIKPPEEIIDRLIDDNLDTFGIEVEEAKYDNTLSFLQSVGVVKSVPPFSEVVEQFGS